MSTSSKPAVRLPTWATDVGAQINDPGTGKQATGWLPDERPPAQFFNWWKNSAGQWVESLSTLYDIERKNFIETDPGFEEDYTDLGSINCIATGLRTSDSLRFFAIGIDGQNATDNIFHIATRDPHNFVGVANGGFGGPAAVGAIAAVAHTSDTFLALSDTSNQGYVLGQPQSYGFAALSGAPFAAATTAKFLSGDNNVFIAIGQNDEIRTSTDGGLSFNTRANPGGAVTSKPVYGNGFWVAGSSSDIIVSTDNGVTWSTATTPVAFNAISYNPALTRFEAVDASPFAAYYATDPSSGTWTLDTVEEPESVFLSANFIQMVHDAAGRATVIGQAGNSAEVVGTSSETDRWRYLTKFTTGSQTTSPGNGVLGEIVEYDGRIVAVGRKNNIHTGQNRAMWMSLKL